MNYLVYSKNTLGANTSNCELLAIVLIVLLGLLMMTVYYHQQRRHEHAIKDR